MHLVLVVRPQHGVGGAGELGGAVVEAVLVGHRLELLVELLEVRVRQVDVGVGRGVQDYFLGPATLPLDVAAGFTRAVMLRTWRHRRRRRHGSGNRHRRRFTCGGWWKWGRVRGVAVGVAFALVIGGGGIGSGVGRRRGRIRVHHDVLRWGQHGDGIGKLRVLGLDELGVDGVEMLLRLGSLLLARSSGGVVHRLGLRVVAAHVRLGGFIPILGRWLHVGRRVGVDGDLMRPQTVVLIGVAVVGLGDGGGGAEVDVGGKRVQQSQQLVCLGIGSHILGGIVANDIIGAEIDDGALVASQLGVHGIEDKHGSGHGDGARRVASKVIVGLENEVDNHNQRSRAWDFSGSGVKTALPNLSGKSSDGNCVGKFSTPGDPRPAALRAKTGKWSGMVY